VLAVSTLAATLLATLYLLSVATETFAARAALNEVEDQDVSVTFRITPDGSLDAILAGSDAAAEQMFGSVPYTRIVTTESKWLAVPRENRQIALAYLASTDALADRVSIVSGKEPQARGGGPVQVIVPQQLLDNLDIQVGATLTMAPFSSRNDKVDYVIVGTYVATDLDDPVWLGDRFRGTGYSATTLIPFTDGRGITDGFGPLYTVQADVEAAPLESVTVTYTPDFSNTSLSQVTDVVNSTADLDLIATRSIGGVAERVTVASRVQETLGGVVGSLAVTRSSVLVTGLLLLVLAVAALSQTARLMAERRYAEQHLMIARGGSGRQIFRLGFIEAIALGVLTAVIAAPLARLTYLTLARAPVMQDAGMNVDPGIPPLTWVVTGIVGFILVLVLVAPLMRRQTSFVDAEQARARPGKRAAFQRSGLDLAVLVLAILAYWQLKNYKSPMLATGGVARVDPLLAAGPALPPGGSARGCAPHPPRLKIARGARCARTQGRASPRRMGSGPPLRSRNIGHSVVDPRRVNRNFRGHVPYLVAPVARRPGALPAPARRHCVQPRSPCARAARPRRCGRLCAKRLPRHSSERAPCWLGRFQPPPIRLLWKTVRTQSHGRRRPPDLQRWEARGGGRLAHSADTRGHRSQRNKSHRDPWPAWEAADDGSGHHVARHR